MIIVLRNAKRWYWIVAIDAWIGEIWLWIIERMDLFDPKRTRRDLEIIHRVIH